MPIKPFKDRGILDLSKNVNKYTLTSQSGSSTTQTQMFDRLRQGVSIRSVRQQSKRNLPILRSADPPSFTDRPLTPYLEICNYGQPKHFKDPGPDGTAAPFEDIVGRFTGKEYLEDDGGTQIYPVILLNPTLKDPGQMDGAIEPLDIRSTVVNSSLGDPYIFHTVRGALMSGHRGHSGKGSEIISQIRYFKVSENCDFFEDNSERLLADVMAPGFVSSFETKIDPFIDSQISTNPTASFSFLSGSYRDRGKFGVTYKSSNSGFIFNPSGVGNTDDENGRVVSTVLGTDSIAFGGLKK